MLKIGVLGLGSIAQKAYLPVYVKSNQRATFVYATRNQEVQAQLMEKYRLPQIYDTLDDLIEQKIDACMIHTATHTHIEMIEKCLSHGIHVYVDKPISEDITEVRRMYELAKRKNCLLIVGFNRRLAPFVQQLKQLPEKRVLTLSKNRIGKAQSVQFEIYDLFLHLVDTANYLLDEEIIAMTSHIKSCEQHLEFASMTLETAHSLAHLTMDMFAGANQENYQITTKNGTYHLKNLTEMTEYNQSRIIVTGFNDWQTTLEKRGFEQAVNQFIDLLEQGNFQYVQEKSLLSHELCAQMLKNYQES